MKIPKYILHPTVLILAGIGVYYLVKAPTPQASQTILNKKAILDQNKLYQIVDFSGDGYLIMEGIKTKMPINDNRFKNLSEDKQVGMQDFFVGKFIKIYEPQKMTVDLPIELYDPLCFSSDPKQRQSSRQCPVILEK